MHTREAYSVRPAVQIETGSWISCISTQGSRDYLGLISRWRNIVFWMYLSPIALMSDASSGRTDIVLGPWLDISNTHLCQGYGPNVACQHTTKRLRPHCEKSYGTHDQPVSTTSCAAKPRNKPSALLATSRANKPRSKLRSPSQQAANTRPHRHPMYEVVDPKDIAPIFRLPKLHVSQPRC
jgi:hypothetical protein